MNQKGEKQNEELHDIRKILSVIVERMVTKEEFNAAVDRMVTKEEFSALHKEVVAFQTETRQNFRDVREDIAGLRTEPSLNLRTFLAV